MKILCRNKDTLFAVIFFLFSMYLFWEISHFHVAAERIRALGPRVFPNTMTGAMAVLSVMLFIKGLRQPRERIIPEKYMKKDLPRPLGMLLGSLSFMPLVDVVGFLVWSIVFLVALQAVMGEKRWLMNILMAFVISLSLYGVFSMALGVPLPRGPLPF